MALLVVATSPSTLSLYEPMYIFHFSGYGIHVLRVCTSLIMCCWFVPTYLLSVPACNRLAVMYGLIYTIDSGLVCTIDGHAEPRDYLNLLAVFSSLACDIDQECTEVRG